MGVAGRTTARFLLASFSDSCSGSGSSRNSIVSNFSRSLLMGFSVTSRDVAGVCTFGEGGSGGLDDPQPMFNHQNVLSLVFVNNKCKYK